MHVIILLALCTLCWLAFPKAFKYMVASWVGFSGGIVLWAIGSTCVMLSGESMSWATMGWSSLASVVLGIIIACVVAARD